MDILSRRLYNGGFNHLKRQTGSLLLRIPRSITQPTQAQANLMSMQHNTQTPLVNTKVRNLHLSHAFSWSGLHTEESVPTRWCQFHSRPAFIHFCSIAQYIVIRLSNVFTHLAENPRGWTCARPHNEPTRLPQLSSHPELEYSAYQPNATP